MTNPERCGAPWGTLLGLVALLAFTLTLIWSNP